MKSSRNTPTISYGDAADNDGQIQSNAGQPNAHQCSQQSTDQPYLCAAREDGANIVLTNLAANPRLQRAIGEGRAQPPQHLRQQDRGEEWDRPLKHEARANQKGASDDRQSPPKNVCQYARWNLAQETDGFQKGAYQHELQRREMRDLHLVDEINGKNGTHKKGG